MRARLLRIVTVAAVVGMTAATAGAQSLLPPDRAVRGDAVGTLGWMNVRSNAGESFDNWANRILDASAGVGFYWTQHLKTEIDVGATTRTEHYFAEPLVVNGINTYRAGSVDFSQRHLAISQQYQFFENAWFHPHLAAGVDVTRENSEEERQPVFLFDPVTRVSRQIEPAGRFGPETRTRVRPFVAAGFKGYLSRRAFFRSDMRVLVRNGADEVLLRFGFGVDF